MEKFLKICFINCIFVIKNWIILWSFESNEYIIIIQHHVTFSPGKNPEREKTQTNKVKVASHNLENKQHISCLSFAFKLSIHERNTKRERDERTPKVIESDWNELTNSLHDSTKFAKKREWFAPETLSRFQIKIPFHLISKRKEKLLDESAAFVFILQKKLFWFDCANDWRECFSL